MKSIVQFVLTFVLPFVLLLGNIAGSITRLVAFTSSHSRQRRCRHCRISNGFDGTQSTTTIVSLKSGVAKGEDSVKVRDLLSDLPTPTLLIELSLAESALNHTSMNLDDCLQQQLASTMAAALDGSVFVHTKITDTSVRDGINKDRGSGKSPLIGGVDASFQKHVPGGAFLGIGLSNHHVGGYYWARGMGIGSSQEAHGVAFRDASQTNGGELYWTKRESESGNGGSGVLRGVTTDESSNSNDGKRSEWADFLVRGDTVQLIPYNATKVLFASGFERLVGVRRVGRPLGSDPIVERLWKRGEDGDKSAWVPL